MFYKGINVYSIILDVNTGNRWSGSKRAYELFGKNLYRGTAINVPGVDWINVIYNPKFPSEVYTVNNVDWEAEDFIEAKYIAGEVNNFTAKQSLRKSLGGIDESISLVDTDHDRITQDKQRFLNSLSRNKGQITKACKSASVSAKIYKDWLITDSEFAESVNFISNEIKDNIEFSLISNAEDGDINSIKYFMDSRAKDRGYGDQKDYRIQKALESQETEDGLDELDLSLLSYEEQCTLNELIIKAQPKRIEQAQ